VGLAAVGWAFGLVRIFDLWFDPLLGLAMDRTRTRLGRFRPWFLAGAPLAELSAKVETMEEPPQEIEIQEGESLEEIKARMSSLKPKKPTISADMLNTANTYDDKVALIRMIVSDDSTRVAGVLKNMIQS
jgi:hypothetical protein